MQLQTKSPQIIDSHTSIQELTSLLLKNRLVDDIDAFLSPPPPELTVPPLRLENAKHILIYGDYDVDGITATAILWQALNHQGFDVTPFIPNRETDGYGFKADSFFRFERQKKLNFDCLITVDNGIVAHPEFKKLKQSRPNIKTIVIDHHFPGTEVLPVDQLIHSTKVSASALSYFVAHQHYLSGDLGLAALGTVADCLPLLDINRSIVFHGLQELRLNPNPGIRKLAEISKIKIDTLSAYDLGFILGPRINAVGRLSDPTDALRLLCAPTSTIAHKYALILQKYNQKRQSLQLDSYHQAEKQIIETDHDLSATANAHSALLFVVGPFNPGIIGLIAGRLTEKYRLPSIVIGLNGQVAKGSCRSISKFNIISALRQCSTLLVDVGGHPAAAGFSIVEKNIPKFQKKILKIAQQELSQKDLTPVLETDAQMTLQAVTQKNIKTINQLEPFGVDNPKPTFWFKGVRVVSKRLLGQNHDHLKLKLDDPNTNYPENIPADAIAFKKGDLDHKLSVGDLIDVVATLDLNTWGGITTPQLIVKEIIKD